MDEKKMCYSPDYQYIHTVRGEVYIDLTRELFSSQAIPLEYVGEVSKYADGSFQEKGITEDGFCVYSLKADRRRPILCYTYMGKKTRAISSCRFSETVAWELNRGSSGTEDSNWELLSNLRKLLAFGFYTEDELDRVAETGKEEPLFGQGSKSPGQEIGDAVPMAKDAVRAVVYIAFRHWMGMNNAALKIAVPLSGTYTHAGYAVRAMERLYTYLPVQLRFETGFSTFASPDMERNLRRIALIFVPEDTSDDGTLSLDGSTESLIQKICAEGTGYPEIDRVVEHIMALEDGPRSEFLKNLYESLEKEKQLGVRVGDYSRISKSLAMRDDPGSKERRIEQWVKYLTQKQNYEDYIMRDIAAMVHGELQQQDVADYAAQRNKGLQAPEQIMQNVESLLPLCKDFGFEKPWQFLVDEANHACRMMESAAMRYDFMTKHADSIVTIAGQERFQAACASEGKQAANDIKVTAMEEIEGTKGQPQDRKKACDAIIQSAKERMQKYSAHADAAEQYTKELQDCKNRILRAQISDIMASKAEPLTLSEYHAYYEELLPDVTLLKTIATQGETDGQLARWDRICIKFKRFESAQNGIVQRVTGADSYFEALKKLCSGISEMKAEYPWVKEEDWEKLLKKGLSGKRSPQSFLGYLEEYEKYHDEKPLSLKGLSSLEERNRLVEDLSRCVGSMDLEENTKSGVPFLVSIPDLRAEVRTILGQKHLELLVDKKSIPASEFMSCLKGRNLVQQADDLMEKGIEEETIRRWIREGRLVGATAEEYIRCEKLDLVDEEYLQTTNGAPKRAYKQMHEKHDFRDFVKKISMPMFITTVSFVFLLIVAVVLNLFGCYEIALPAEETEQSYSMFETPQKEEAQGDAEQEAVPDFESCNCYEQFVEKSIAEKLEFIHSFGSRSAFDDWYDKEKADYEDIIAGNAKLASSKGGSEKSEKGKK